ncbi:MAG: GTPase-associated system all-helical protein GASH [Methylobacter sp.]|nr:GTPase-associated system all-helical protein GASH [Methylobacter sp.]
MTELLTGLLNAGLIENLNGDDERFSKIEQAAKTVAQQLREQPLLLIRAILVGLAADIAEDDPIIVQAEQALVAEWKAVRSVFPDMPVNLLRAILLDACNQVAEEDNNAAILWLTAADTLPLLKLGREEAVVRSMLEAWAGRAEEKALAGLALTADEAEQTTVGELQLPKITKLESPKVNRAALLQKVERAAGPHNAQSQTMDDPNPHWPNVGHQWSYQFAPRMQQLLADELDALAIKLGKSQSDVNQQVQACLTDFTGLLNETLALQQDWVQRTQQAEQIRLNALWWSEALYSSSLRCSYRELTPAIASMVMTVDLLNEVAKPTPASVGYLLAEAVNRLSEASFNQKISLQTLLEELDQARQQLSKDWLETLTAPPDTGRLSLRDAAVLVLTGKTQDFADALNRVGASGEFEMSLPQFAQALFRQEQAVQLAGELHE